MNKEQFKNHFEELQTKLEETKDIVNNLEKEIEGIKQQLQFSDDFETLRQMLTCNPGMIHIPGKNPFPVFCVIGNNNNDVNIYVSFYDSNNELGFEWYRREYFTPLKL